MEDNLKHCFSEVQDIPGWFDFDDAQFISQINTKQQEKLVKGNILELGIWEGKSFIFMADLLEMNEELTGIDLFEGAKGQQRLNNLLERLKSKSKKIRVLRGDTRALMDSPPPTGFRSQRIIHVDAGHEHSEVLADLNNIEKFALNQGSVIILDDLPVRHFPGVWSGLASWILLGNGSKYRPFLISRSKAYIAKSDEVYEWQRYILDAANNPKSFAWREVFDGSVLVHNSRDRNRRFSLSLEYKKG